MAKQNTTTDANTVPLVLSWALVGIPLVWGITRTLINAAKLFK